MAAGETAMLLSIQILGGALFRTDRTLAGHSDCRGSDRVNSNAYVQDILGEEVDVIGAR